MSYNEGRCTSRFENNLVAMNFFLLFLFFGECIIIDTWVCPTLAKPYFSSSN